MNINDLWDVILLNLDKSWHAVVNSKRMSFNKYIIWQQNIENTTIIPVCIDFSLQQRTILFLQWCRLVLMMLFRFGVSCFVLQTYPSWFGRCVLTTDKSSVSILSSINLKIQECTSWQIIIMYSLFIISCMIWRGFYLKDNYTYYMFNQQQWYQCDV
jgi:hypothetical protein